MSQEENRAGMAVYGYFIKANFLYVFVIFDSSEGTDSFS